MQSRRLNYEKIFEVANVGAYRTTPDGKVVYANKYLANLLGYGSVDELLRMNLGDGGHFCPGYSRDEFKKSIEKNGYYKGQSCWISRDGKRIHIMEFAIRIRDGDEVYYEGIVENITPLVEAYEREKRLKEEWVNLFNAVPDSVIILSEDQTILDVNKATIDLLHMPKEDIVGRKCYEIFHQSNEPPEGCPFVKMMESKDYSGISEMVMDTIGGKYLVTVALYDMVGGEKRIIHFAKDVNQIYDMREKLIENLRRYNRILKMINSVNSLFLKERNEHYLIRDVCREIGDVEFVDGVCISIHDDEHSMDMVSECNLECPKNWNLEFEKNALKFSVEYGGRSFGHLIIALNQEPNSGEIELFRTIAYDLGYVIRSIRLEMEKERMQREIERNMEDLTILVDGIRNPLAVLMGIAETELPPSVRERIVGEIEKINSVTKKVDEIWKRTEDLRNYLEK